MYDNTEMFEEYENDNYEEEILADWFAYQEEFNGEDNERY